MNRNTLDYLMSRMESRRGDRRDSRDYEDGRRRGRNGRFVRDRDDGRGDRRDSRDYEDGIRSRRDMRDYEDGRGRGNVDFEGTMDFRARDYNDGYDSRDYADYGNAPKISKEDIRRWKQMMENGDGTRGPHYDMQQIVATADKMGIRFREFDEKELCMTVNMMYSDYCKVAKKYVDPDKEMMFFMDLAIAFLDDDDGPAASEKLALYFQCVVDA